MSKPGKMHCSIHVWIKTIGEQVKDTTKPRALGLLGHSDQWDADDLLKTLVTKMFSMKNFGITMI